MSFALELTNVSKIYEGEKQALTSISLSVKKGEFFALLGPNGAGKSTLIGIICSLVQKTEGDVKVYGIPLEGDISSAKMKIGLVPQEFNFNFFEKVEDILFTQAGYYGISRKEAEPQITLLLTKLGLLDKRTEKSMKLSGGMKRRLLIARALVHKPTLLFLDEPTAGVDIELRHEMYAFLQELNKDGVTIILTTHYLEEVERLCKRMAIISKGSIVSEGLLEDLVKDKTLEEVYLQATRA